MHTRRSRVTGSNRNCPQRGTIHIAVHPGQPLQIRSTITLGRLSPSAAAHTIGTPLSGSLMSLLIVWSLIEHPPVITRRIGVFLVWIPAHSRQRVCDPHATRATPPHSTKEFRVSETRLESGVPLRGTIRRGCNPSQTYAGAGQRIRITRTADDRAYRGDLCRRFWQGWSLTMYRRKHQTVNPSRQMSKCPCR
jgi:hypothetical protein